MIYRHNDATLIAPYIDGTSLRREYKVIGGTCRVKGLSVTGGQDPNGYNHAGQVKTFGENGRLRFKVGRKASAAVASWWKSRVPASQCTFNHTPGKLNFAFYVDLMVKLTGGNLGSRVASVRLDDLYIGQGRAGSGNNWWFGGRHCVHIGGGKVRVEGLDMATKLKIFVDVKRGSSNPANHFEFSNYRLAEAESWMKRIDSTKTLSQIVLPGSHDAGMGATRDCHPSGLGQSLSRNQQHTVRGQLNHGARYLDIRADYDKGKLVTYHRNDERGCSGQYVDSVLADVNSFLSAYPSETVILKFSHIRDHNGNMETTKRLLAEQVGRFTRTFRSTSVTNLAHLKLGDVRGKAIMVFDYNDYLSPASGRYRYVDGVRGGQLAVYDKYTNTSTLSTMSQDQLAKWQTHGGLGKHYLFLLSWTLTPGLTTPSILAMARLANAALPSVLDRYFKVYRSKPNIVFIDGLDRSVTSSIISLNFL
ncbi:hypothetical protein N430_04534 [Pseudomonas sp. CC120222-01a]|nr:hypothetical protein N430_04534 [Pseudomonas sp. CC120222-01a]